MLYCENLLGLQSDCHIPYWPERESSTGWLLYDAVTGGWYVGFRCPNHGDSGAWRPEWQSVMLRNVERLKADDAYASAAYLIAQLSALSGQREQSFRYLNDAVKNRSLEIPNLLGGPALDSLRGDPRFAGLVGRVESLRR